MSSSPGAGDWVALFQQVDPLGYGPGDGHGFFSPVSSEAIDQIEAEHRQKRGGGKVLDEAALKALKTTSGTSPFGRIVSEEPTPQYAATMADECRRLRKMWP
jgi:hypothetical protein